MMLFYVFLVQIVGECISVSERVFAVLRGKDLWCFFVHAVYVLPHEFLAAAVFYRYFGGTYSDTYSSITYY